jgi:acyl carrier protein
MQQPAEDLATVKTRLKELIVSHLSLVNVTPDQIKDDAPLFGEGLGLDSLDAVELVVMLQRYYGISVEDSEVGRRIFASINALAEYVQANRTK